MGLYKFDLAAKDFTSYTIEEGWPNNLSNSIVVDDNNHLWISTNKGISKISMCFYSYTLHKLLGLCNDEIYFDIKHNEEFVQYQMNRDFYMKNTNKKIGEVILDVSYCMSEENCEVFDEDKEREILFKFETKKNTDLLTQNTLFLSKKDGKYGYVNKNNVVVINYIYDDATEQNDCGYVAVKQNGKWGTINSKGEKVVEPSLTMENNSIIDFIGTWHLAEDINANYYTK